MSSPCHAGGMQKCCKSLDLSQLVIVYKLNQYSREIDADKSPMVIEYIAESDVPIESDVEALALELTCRDCFLSFVLVVSLTTFAFSRRDPATHAWFPGTFVPHVTLPRHSELYIDFMLLTTIMEFLPLSRSCLGNLLLELFDLTQHGC